MKSWIAHEHTELGLPTECCLIVTAHTQTEAKQLMSTAITAQSTTATRQNRDRTARRSDMVLGQRLSC